MDTGSFLSDGFDYVLNQSQPGVTWFSSKSKLSSDQAHDHHNDLCLSDDAIDIDDDT